MGDDVLLPTRCPTAAARNADLLNRKYGGDVKHYTASDKEGRGDAADQWLKENDPLRRRNNKQSQHYMKDHLMTTTLASRTEDTHPAATSSDVRISVMRDPRSRNNATKISVYFAQHLAKYIFRKSLTDNQRVRVNIQGRTITICDLGAQITPAVGRPYASAKNGKMQRVQLYNSEASFGIEGLVDQGIADAHYVKVMSDNSLPLLKIDIPDELFEKVETQTEPRSKGPFYQAPDYDPNAGDSHYVEESIDLEPEQDAVEAEPEVPVEPQPEPTVATHTEDLITQEPAAMTDTATLDRTADTATSTTLAVVATSEYENKLEQVAVALRMLNEAADDPAVAPYVTFSVENNRIVCDAPVVVRKRIS